MSQKIAKLWGLSALATKLLFRQIYCHHQPFTSVGGFLKRLTKNKSLKFEVEFFGNVGATRETKEDDKKNCPLMFLGLFWFCPLAQKGLMTLLFTGAIESFNRSGQLNEDSFWIVEKVVDAVD